MEGKIPDTPKWVMIAAPHTSNWDFSVMLSVAFAFEIKLSWMGKNTLFKWPFGSFFRYLGGIPVNRSRSENAVHRMVQLFNEVEALVLGIPPEGTRRKVRTWKTGFYHIAHGANVPIALGFIDYERKASGVGPIIQPTGDIDIDMKEIHAFYATVKGKHPSNQ
jgi:1-acyl-sn-glycerol-3-phosphate acyltransferase